MSTAAMAGVALGCLAILCALGIALAIDDFRDLFEQADLGDIDDDGWIFQ